MPRDSSPYNNCQSNSTQYTLSLNPSQRVTPRVANTSPTHRRSILLSNATTSSCSMHYMQLPCHYNVYTKDLTSRQLHWW